MTRITGTYAEPDAKVDLDIYSYDGSTWVLAATIDSSAFDTTITRAGITRVAFVIVTNDTYAPGSDTVATVTDLTLYGIDGVTSTTTNNVFDDVVDNEIDTDYLPAGAAYRAWIDAEATVVTPLVFGHTTADAKFSELTKYAANTYGWYMERVAGIPYCVPHWYALSTTPDYVIQLDRADPVGGARQARNQGKRVDEASTHAGRLRTGNCLCFCLGGFSFRPWNVASP